MVAELGVILSTFFTDVGKGALALAIEVAWIVDSVHAGCPVVVVVTGRGLVTVGATLDDACKLIFLRDRTALALLADRLTLC